MNKGDSRLHILGKEKIPKALLSLGIPAIIGMLVNAVLLVIDTFFLGIIGTSAIGATAIAFPLFMFIGAMGLTFGVGAASYVSRLLGQNKREQANQTATVAFVTSALTALLVSLTGLLFLDEILILLGASDSILPLAREYSRVLIMGAMFTMLNMCMNNLLRAEGSARISMIGMSIAALANIILDPIFIFLLHQGVAGAAQATVLAQIISFAVLFSYFLRKKSLLRIKRRNFKPSKIIYGEIMKIGFPTLIRQALVSIAMGMVNVCAALYGDAAVAAMGIITRVFSLPLYVMFGYNQGFQPLAGYNFGAGLFSRLKEAIRVSLKWSSIFSLTISTLFFFGSGIIIGVFSRDPQVIAIATRGLKFYSLFFPFMGFIISYNGLCQALGYAGEAMVLSLSRQGLFLIPALLILSSQKGLTGILMAQPLADGLTLLLTIALTFQIHRKIRKSERLLAERSA
ncbi:MAG: MATE family efflux transporter [Spirochaetaceae bacterium 4572_59]|nr:MAG: MATE family efflux transporter [Spirochaetaceae bacterium 4572_59]